MGSGVYVSYWVYLLVGHGHRHWYWLFGYDIWIVLMMNMGDTVIFLHYFWRYRLDNISI